MPPKAVSQKAQPAAAAVKDASREQAVSSKAKASSGAARGGRRRHGPINEYDAATRGKLVSVYCWSRSTPGSPRYQEAEALGRQLAEAGFGVVTGGYNGSMEAVSKGAREAGNVTVRGILVPGQFPDRVLVGNQFLTQKVEARSLVDRLDKLTHQTRYFVVLPGTLGTLTELTLIWCLASVHPAGQPAPVILCWRDPWEKLLQQVGTILQLPAEHMALVKFVDRPEDCVRIISEDYAAGHPQAEAAATRTSKRAADGAAAAPPKAKEPKKQDAEHFDVYFKDLPEGTTEAELVQAVKAGSGIDLRLPVKVVEKQYKVRRGAAAAAAPAAEPHRFAFAHVAAEQDKAAVVAKSPFTVRGKQVAVEAVRDKPAYAPAA